MEIYNEPKLEQSGSQFIAFLPAIALALVTVLFAAAAAYWPPKTGEMAVVFAPGTAETAAFQAVVAAGGSYVGRSKFENIVVAYANTPDFAARVSDLGGLFTMAATGLCSPENKPSPFGASNEYQ